MIAKDLRQKTAPQEILDQTGGGGAPVKILVNNAGHGQRGKFWEIPVATDVSMIELNILAYLRLTKIFLLEFLEREHGRILNTASIAGFMPDPLQAVYHATKAFVLSWSEALSTELEGYEALMDGRRVAVAGAGNKELVFSRHLLPDILQSKINGKFYERIPPDEQKIARGDKEKAAAEAG